MITGDGQQPQTAQQKKQANELVQTVREVTERFKDVSQAGPTAPRSARAAAIRREGLHQNTVVGTAGSTRRPEILPTNRRRTCCG
jgi:hypothetical protein